MSKYLAAVVNGLATSLFMIWMIWFLHYNYLQIKKTLIDKENKEALDIWKIYKWCSFLDQKYFKKQERCK